MIQLALRSPEYASHFSITTAAANNDKLIPADYDADGKADAMFFRPSTGVWTVHQSSDGSTKTQTFGDGWDQIPYAK